MLEVIEVLGMTALLAFGLFGLLMRDLDARANLRRIRTPDRNRSER